MTDQSKPILIKDMQGETLKSFSLQERDRAFAYLKDLEQWGVEGILEEPSLPETLINSLGASLKDREELKQAIEDEINDHDSSCCFQAGNEKK